MNNLGQQDWMMANTNVVTGDPPKVEDDTKKLLLWGGILLAAGVAGYLIYKRTK